jgi:hypothetical protein
MNNPGNLGFNDFLGDLMDEAVDHKKEQDVMV